MSSWVQHGYGKGDKVDRLADASRVAGVVLSPADEDRDALKAFVKRLTSLDVRALLDPQLYVYSIEGGTTRCHDTHGLEFPDVRWSASAKTIEAHVASVVEANEDLGIDEVIAPSPLQSGFLDFWAPVALQYARTMAEATERSTLASLVIDESALGEWESAEEWLDEASQLEVAGYYVIAARGSGPYPTAWNAGRLTSYLRLAHRLIRNEYSVLAGYTDVEALALAAVGADTATGWFYSQRRFTESKWRPTSGGQTAIPRVMSDKLLVPMQLQEAERILRSNVADRFTENSGLRAAVTAGGWGASQSRQQYLEAISDLTAMFAKGSDVRDRVIAAIARFKAAEQNLGFLGGRGLLPGAPAYIRLIQAIREALEGLRDLELTN